MAIFCSELPAWFQRHAVIYNVEYNSVLKRYYRIRPRWVQRHVVHILVVGMSQQQRASHVVPQFHGSVNLATSHKDGFPVTHGQTKHTATVQLLAKRFELYLWLKKHRITILHVIHIMYYVTPPQDSKRQMSVVFFWNKILHDFFNVSPLKYDSIFQ